MSNCIHTYMYVSTSYIVHVPITYIVLETGLCTYYVIMCLICYWSRVLCAYTNIHLIHMYCKVYNVHHTHGEALRDIARHCDSTLYILCYINHCSVLLLLLLTAADIVGVVVAAAIGEVVVVEVETVLLAEVLWIMASRLGDGRGSTASLLHHGCTIPLLAVKFFARCAPCPHFLVSSHPFDWIECPPPRSGQSRWGVVVVVVVLWLIT